MLLRLLLLVCTGVALLTAAPVVAADRIIWTPERLAAAVEREASRTSFGDLERFGREALAGRAPDRLERLDHVQWIYLGEADAARFADWNGALRREAVAAGNRRYAAIADLDALRVRYDQGDISAETGVLAASRGAPDWFVRAHAMMLEAYFQTLRNEAAKALGLLADADRLVIANGRPWDRALIWDTEGLALMRLHDLNGAAEAFGRSQFEFGRPGYPRPDFDEIWNLSGLAAQTGRPDLARTLYRTEHRLAGQAGVPALRVWDDTLCAAVAESLDDPHRVLACLRPLGPGLKGAGFVAQRVLPGRAIAYARLGRLAEARRDLAAFERLARRLQASHQSVFGRLPEVQAAILHAEGRDTEAFETLRRYARDHQMAQSVAFGQGVGQMTGLMAEQLSFRQNELEEMRKNLALVDRVVSQQRFMFLTGGLFGLVVLAFLVWQWRVSRQLRIARLAAEAGGRAKGEFLANMSHEIRTPLNGLLTMAEVMARDPLPEEQRRRLSVVRQAGRDLLRLLNDILDFSKIEAGKLELEAIPFDVDELLAATLAGFSATADAKGLSLALDVAPEARGRRRGDPTRVRQVVANFVANALKFTERGGVKIRITGLGADGADGLQIAVEDTGVGIPSDKMAVLFRKFSQVDASTTRRFGGTGLGLAISQELATLMGGRVWVDSTVGRGSTFYATLKLPILEPADDAAEATCEPDRAQAQAQAQARPLRLLAAEDNAMNQVVLSTITRAFGIELVVVDNGAQAVEAWREGAFDAILMDVQMPVMDGVQATRAIRAAEVKEQRSRTPIVALSANAFAHQIAEYLAAGMDAHVVKPIELNALQAALEAVVAERPPSSPIPVG